MRLEKLNKVIEEDDPERIREYIRMGFTEEKEDPLKETPKEEPIQEKKSRRKTNG